MTEKRTKKRRNQKRKHVWGFYPMFVLIVAAILILSIFIGSAFIYLAFSLGLIDASNHSPFPLLILIALPSLIIGLLFAIGFGQKAVKPINNLSDALKKVAEGDFSVRLNEDMRGNYGEVSQNFNLMAQELSSIEMLRSDFITNVSHEFKSPLSSIQGYATLLQDQNLEESERQEYLDAIFSATRTLSNMSSNILDLSNLETQTTEIMKKKFSLDEQIRHVIVMFDPLGMDKEIGLDIDLEDVDIEANPELLETVWINIFGNALKFSEQGGEIIVRLNRIEDEACVSFEDIGCGMSEEEVARIFDKFYQADGSHKTEGSGLGLALADTIVRQHGGRIEVSSTPGKGSTFVVLLPLAG